MLIVTIFEETDMVICYLLLHKVDGMQEPSKQVSSSWTEEKKTQTERATRQLAGQPNFLYPRKKKHQRRGKQHAHLMMPQ
jgi:hypothetical protein